MYSFIIASANQEKGHNRAIELSSGNEIDPFDIATENFEKSVGIEDVRSIQKKLFFKAVKSKNKSIIINASLGLTTESQNALLKILEEPPANTFIYIVVKNLNNILPTIISRCKIIEISNDYETSEEDLREAEQLLKIISSQEAGKKLKIAQDFGKSREEAIAWLEKSIFDMRSLLLEKIETENADYSKKIAIAIKKLERGHNGVRNTNVTPRFIIENALLS